MSIKEKVEEIKQGKNKRFETVITAIIIILVGLLSFGLGKLSHKENRGSIRIEKVSIFENLAPSSNIRETLEASAAGFFTNEAEVVGSRNSDKYHYPWCSGAKRISESNRVYFKTIEEAQAAGYSPAGNCPGLQ